MSSDEIVGLYEHAARTHRRVVDATIEWLEHFHHQLNNVARCIELTAKLSLVRGELREKVFEYSSKNVEVLVLLGGKILGFAMVSLLMLVSYGGLGIAGLGAAGMADLVSPDPRFGPFMGQAMLVQNVNALIQMIQNSTGDPQLWQQGVAPITFDPITRSPLVWSMITKLSEVTLRKLTASAGYDSCVHCHCPSA